MSEPLGTWQALERELAAWTEAGLRASLWWRDDDAIEPTAALDRLLGLAAASGVPLALAVVPARATAALARGLAQADGEVAVLQHGFAHRNHAAPGAKKIELGGPRAPAEVTEELARGSAMMSALFGEQSGRRARPLPVLVPPWNRIGEGLAPLLPALGFRGLSGDGPRPARVPAPGLVQVNTHLDIMRWAAPRGFLGEAPCLGRLTGHLQARREGRVDAAEPTGLLTHHLAHDGAAWCFLERLVPWLAGHPAVLWLAAGEIFGIEAAR